MTLFKVSAIGLTFAAVAFGCNDESQPATLPAMTSSGTSPAPGGPSSGTPEGVGAAADGGMASGNVATSDSGVANNGGTAANGAAAGGGTTAGDGGTANNGGAAAGDGGTAVTPPPADPGTVTGPTRMVWNAAGATLSGTGCPSGSGSAAVVSEPGGVRIDLPEMKVDLSTTAQLADRKACSIRIPIEIPAGFYVSKVDNKLAYSLARTAGTTAGISTNVGFFGNGAQPFTVNHPTGVPESLPNASALRSDTYASSSPEAQGMCRNTRPTAGLLAVNVAISARRDGPGESLFVMLKPMSIREGIEIELSPCQ